MKAAARPMINPENPDGLKPSGFLLEDSPSIRSGTRSPIRQTRPPIAFCRLLSRPALQVGDVSAGRRFRQGNNLLKRRKQDMAAIGRIEAMASMRPRSQESEGVQFSKLILNRVKREMTGQGELSHIVLRRRCAKEQLEHLCAHLREQNFDGGTKILQDANPVSTAVSRQDLWAQARLMRGARISHRSARATRSTEPCRRCHPDGFKPSLSLGPGTNSCRNATSLRNRMSAMRVSFMFLPLSSPAPSRAPRRRSAGPDLTANAAGSR
jgi:hypothetical protein